MGVAGGFAGCWSRGEQKKFAQGLFRTVSVLGRAGCRSRAPQPGVTHLGLRISGVSSFLCAAGSAGAGGAGILAVAGAVLLQLPRNSVNRAGAFPTEPPSPIAMKSSFLPSESGAGARSGRVVVFAFCAPFRRRPDACLCWDLTGLKLSTTTVLLF